MQWFQVLGTKMKNLELSLSLRLFSTDILDLSGFMVWTTISRGWAFVAAAFIIIVPLYQEVSHIITTKLLKLNVCCSVFVLLF